MSVERIEQYKDTLKVILKPTKKFPEGRNYFYCDSEDIDLVQSHSWHLEQGNTNICVRAINSFRISYRFHRELAYKYLGYYPKYLDHISGVEFDNIDSNLNEVSLNQNIRNRVVKNYIKTKNKFRVRSSAYSVAVITQQANTEIEACQIAYSIETSYLKELMGNQYYMYDFLKDRRNDLNILDLERTGVISQDEATYQHVLRYADNAWFYYRYGLEDYFRQHHILVPSYSLDEQGFMIHPVTGQKLCPF